MNDLDGIKNRAISALNEAPNTGVLTDLEKAYLGKKGEVILLFRTLKDMPEEDRKIFGRKLHALKMELEEAFVKKRGDLGGKDTPKKTGRKLDVTAPGKKFEQGNRHILSRVIKDACDIFESLGFSVVSGPDVETERYNFDALNIPADHPARDMWDTFWMEKPGLLLRTHTSPVQVRFMEKNNPPLRIVVPGRCYRYEATDSSHEVQFYQLEGLMIGEKVNLAHLKGILEIFFRRIFMAKDLEIRFRPSFFPFTEPSVEVDLRRGKKGKWLEVAGAGMVHPQVLKNVKIDPDKWQGFAFGMGLDRIAMLKYKIEDIRLFYGNDLRFIKQFK